MARARRPTVVAHLSARLVRDLDQRAGLHLADPQHPVLVAESDPRAVGGPAWFIEHGAEAFGQLAGGRGAEVVDQPDLLFAAAVADKGDAAAVRRERGVLVMRAGALGQVADVAVLPGDGQDLAASSERCAAAAGAERVACDVPARVDGLGTLADAVVGHPDGDRGFLA